MHIVRGAIIKDKTYYRECSCEFCGKVFNNINGLNGHRPYCKFNPNKLSAWNKGLTKETNENVLKYSKSSANTKSKDEYKENHPIWNKGLTKETSESVLKYSESMVATKSNNEWKEQLRLKIHEKYDGKHFTQTDKYKETCKEKCFEKYGVEHPMQVQRIFDKTLNATYRRKDYILPDGRVIKIQGYENYALDYLFENGYTVDDIEFSLPKIFYKNGKRKSRYYPDIFIKTENMLIEVKSTYTVECNKDINVLKQKSSIEHGFEHEFWVIDPNKEIYKIRNINEYYSRKPVGRNCIRRI